MHYGNKSPVKTEGWRDDDPVRTNDRLMIPTWDWGDKRLLAQWGWGMSGWCPSEDKWIDYVPCGDSIKRLKIKDTVRTRGCSGDDLVRMEGCIDDTQWRLRRWMLRDPVEIEGWRDNDPLRELVCINDNHLGLDRWKDINQLRIDGWMDNDPVRTNELNMTLSGHLIKRWKI